MNKITIIAYLLLFSGLAAADSMMNQVAMENIVKEMAQKSKGKQGFVEFSYRNVKMYLISDAKHNRMRIISPIVKYKDMLPHDIESVLESNFHKSLDARYAISKGVLYSAYIHPLSALRKYEITSAVNQVANLVLSFGKEYTSGTLTYK